MEDTNPAKNAGPTSTDPTKEVARVSPSQFRFQFGQNSMQADSEEDVLIAPLIRRGAPD